MDHTVARAFQGVKNCVVRELEYGSYPSNVDDALRVIWYETADANMMPFSRRVWLLARRRNLLGLCPVLDRRSVQGAVLPMMP